MDDDTGMDTQQFDHITRAFQRKSKVAQALHLIDDHGVDATVAELTRRVTARTPVWMRMYQRHVTAHDDERTGR